VNAPVSADPKLVAGVMRAGASEALFRGICERLWAANQACQEASKDRAKSFTKQLKAARAALDAAETLHTAWVKHERS